MTLRALAEYLAECTSREFAVSGQLEVVALGSAKWYAREIHKGPTVRSVVGRRTRCRAGRVAALRTSKPTSPSGTNGWTCCTSCPIHSRARFSVSKARQLLGYQPQHLRVTSWKVLLIGANGYLGPHVVKANPRPTNRLRITDVRPPVEEIKRTYGEHEFRQVDVTDEEQSCAPQRHGRDHQLVRRPPRSQTCIPRQHAWLLSRHASRREAQHSARALTPVRISRSRVDVRGLDFSIPPDVPPHPGTGCIRFPNRWTRDLSDPGRKP